MSPPLEAGLSRFVGLFMVATNLLTVAMCLAFFGDQARDGDIPCAK